MKKVEIPDSKKIEELLNKIISKAKTWKAAGSDGVKVGLIKYIPEVKKSLSTLTEN